MNCFGKGAVLAAAIALSTTAFADGGPRGGSVKDAPAPSVFSWTGLYIGANVGYAHNESSAAISAGPAGTFTQGILAAGFLPARHSPEGDGVIGGFQFGYNHQMGQLVAGVELDLAGTTAGATHNVNLAPGFNAVYASNLQWLSTVRGRLGVLVSPSLLAYATAGFAFGEVERSYGFNFPGNQAFGKKNSVDTGWTVGGGLEWAFSSKASIGAEYLFVNLEGNSFNATNFGGGCALFGDCATRINSGDTDLHIARLKLNFKF